MKKKALLSFIILSLLNRYVFGLDIDYTILIGASQHECYHQTLEKGNTLEFMYDVFAGGDYDISFWLYSPVNRLMQSDFKQRDGQHSLVLVETGDYRFCFDNSFSSFSQKQVYFSIRLVNTTEEDDETWMADVPKDDLGDLQTRTEEFKAVFMRLWANMEQIQRYQQSFRNFEGHDRVMGEHNFERVNFWSMVHLAVLISVGLIQVIMIRSLFEDRSRVGKILRGNK
ncbi:unnamed protein product [Didymodactylos carnosus]|uniref:GOLD domain-containing protein n=1 Tax=Didymodactylos carnosus TaxID=1234261 RepID=A0A8S2DEL9_9BILA|nr:unnamed protein product [Didymodactylos carnosus]CAF3662021.1 unnamed protein product [Didymodactylos carnosus]